MDWMKGIGCFVWDRPEMVQAEKNKTLYSEVRDPRYRIQPVMNVYFIAHV